MTNKKLIAKKIGEESFKQVVAYGFYTQEGVEEELEKIVEGTDTDEEQYTIMEYNEEMTPKLYYDGRNFCSTFTGARYRA